MILNNIYMKSPKFLVCLKVFERSFFFVVIYRIYLVFIYYILCIIPR